MKKIKVLFIIVAILGIFSKFAYAEEKIMFEGEEFTIAPTTWYYINDQYIDFNSNGIATTTLTYKFNGNDVNLMPIRAFAEAIGASLSYFDTDVEYKVWRIEYAPKNCAIEIMAGQKIMDIYKKDTAGDWNFECTVELQSPVAEYNSTTYVPFREAIRGLMGWYDSTNYENYVAENDDKFINYPRGEYKDFVIIMNVEGIKDIADIPERNTVAHEVKLGDNTMWVSYNTKIENFKKALYRICNNAPDVALTDEILTEFEKNSYENYYYNYSETAGLLNGKTIYKSLTDSFDENIDNVNEICTKSELVLFTVNGEQKYSKDTQIDVYGKSIQLNGTSLDEHKLFVKSNNNTTINFICVSEVNAEDASKVNSRYILDGPDIDLGRKLNFVSHDTWNGIDTIYGSAADNAADGEKLLIYSKDSENKEVVVAVGMGADGQNVVYTASEYSFEINEGKMTITKKENTEQIQTPAEETVPESEDKDTEETAPESEDKDTEETAPESEDKDTEETAPEAEDKDTEEAIPETAPENK